MQKIKANATFEYVLTAKEIAAKFGLDFSGYELSASMDGLGRVHLHVESYKLPEPLGEGHQ